MSDQTDIREQVAAFLAGDLDGPAADALQGRIDAEPWVARLADEMAAMLVELGGVDAADPPPGFSERLHARLERDLGRPLASPLPDERRLRAVGAAAATGWAEDARPRGRRDVRGPVARRTHDRRRLSAALGVAAVFVVLAVTGVGVLTQEGVFGGADDSAESADTAFSTAVDDAVQDEAAEDSAVDADEDLAASTGDARTESAEAAAEDAAASAPAAESDGQEATEEEAAEEEAADVADAEEGETALSAPAPTGRPATLTLGEVSGSDAAIAEAVGGHPAAASLRGTDAGDVVELAAAYRDELLRGPDFDDGTPAGACLIEVLDAAGPDLVPAVAAQLDLPAGPAVAYALVRSTDGTSLDAVDVWLLDLPGCAVDRVLRQG